MGIANIINNSTTTSGGEIVRELVNSSDGAGLNLEDNGYVDLTNSAAAEFGTSDFSIEFIVNQTGDNTNDNYIYFSHTSGNSRVMFWNDISADNINVRFTNSSGSNTDVDLAYDMSADYGTPTHYVFAFDRSAFLTLYKNGYSVATVDISSTSSIDIGAGNTNVGRFGSGTNYGILGTFYRFRTWNKLVDAKALFERADVDFADQYGSQTNLLTDAVDRNWGTNAADATAFNAAYKWVSYYTATISVTSNVLTFSTSATNRGIYIASPNISLKSGKRYRATFATGAITGTTYSLYTYNGSGFDKVGTLAASTTNVIEFVVPAQTDGNFHILSENSTAGSIQLTGASVTNEIVTAGVVSDYDLAFAQPALSTLIQDRSNAADGVASSSGVTQVQPITQLNSTSARIGSTQLAAGASPYIPADGSIVADKLGVGIAPSHAATIYGTGAGNATVQIEGEGGADPTINFLTNNTTHWAIGVDDSDSDKFKIVKHSAIGSTNNFLTISSTGLATFSNGIALQTSPTNASATANEAYTLDKYETGNFTGSLTAATPPTSVPTATGNYTRIGNLVHFQIKFNNANTTGASGQMEITGLPFPAANNNDSDYSPVNVIFYNLPYSNSEGIIYTNESKIRFYNIVDGAAWNNYSISAGSGKYLWISGTYKA